MNEMKIFVSRIISVLRQWRGMSNVVARLRFCEGRRKSRKNQINGDSEIQLIVLNVQHNTPLVDQMLEIYENKFLKCA